MLLINLSLGMGAGGEVGVPSDGGTAVPKPGPAGDMSCEAAGHLPLV